MVCDMVFNLLPLHYFSSAFIGMTTNHLKFNYFKFIFVLVFSHFHLNFVQI
jgi:hypothetical protein